MIRLVNDTISTGDIRRLTEWLAATPRLTMGERVEEFEAAFSQWLGVKHTVFVNSGSSANLLMVYLLKYKYGVKRMAVPALSWVTDISPLIQFGIEPVLIDCNMDNLCMDLDQLEEVIGEVDAVLHVSVLGLVPDIDRIVKMCKEHDIPLIEDNCESMGSQRGSVKLGTFGLMSSHSLYFGHHISTIEGGLISTDDDELYNLLKMFRSHGWSRNVDEKTRATLREDMDDFTELYTFYVPGFNVRPTEVQAFIGLWQLDKLDHIALRRFNNFKLYHDILSNAGRWVPQFRWFDFVSNLGFPVISEERAWNVKRLRENDVEVRPLISGSMGSQPFYKKEYGECILPNANRVHKYGFYVPNHPGLTITDINKVCRLILTYD